MKIVEINGTNYASTGNIALNIAKKAREHGFEVFTCCKKSRKSLGFKYDNQIYIGTRFERVLSEKLSELTGYLDSFNFFGTVLFVRKLKKIKPDLIHLHVIHNTYINHSILFKYIKDNNIPVVWTFHDCWAFTGKCPYFERNNCYKWENECFNCPSLKEYPQTIFDKSTYLNKKKKKIFSNINNTTIVTPSNWLMEFVNKSYFNNKNRMVIYNGINLNVFKPIKSSVRDNKQIGKYMLLGVANTWSPRKGLNAFIELASKLPKEYSIVLVGTNNDIDKNLPNNIVSIHKTYDINELVELYSSADLFVNPTLEDNLPTVNIEALACGTPVITYDTGGCSEIVDEKSGLSIEKGNLNELLNGIIDICENKRFNRSDCLKRAKSFDMNLMCENYIRLYESILKR